MQEIRKVDRTWQFKVGGEWQDAHVEPNVPILQPNWDGEGFVWPDLELKVAGKKGLGVFAARDLPKGTAIPILGEKKEERYCTNRHNIGYYDKSRPGTGFRGCIDGDPTQHPYKDVGYFGLSIAMMLNEASKPNCAFRESNYVQLVRKVKKGQELTVYYGDSRDMTKIRKDQGYSISHDPDTVIKPDEVGTPAQRVQNFKFWMGIISNMEDNHSHIEQKEPPKMPRKKAQKKPKAKTLLNALEFIADPGMNDVQTLKWLKDSPEVVGKKSFSTYVDASGLTMAMWAADKGKLETLKFLVDQGADIHKVHTASEYTARQLADENEHAHVVAWIDSQSEKEDKKDDAPLPSRHSSDSSVRTLSRFPSDDSEVPMFSRLSSSDSIVPATPILSRHSSSDSYVPATPILSRHSSVDSQLSRQSSMGSLRFSPSESQKEEWRSPLFDLDDDSDTPPLLRATRP